LNDLIRDLSLMQLKKPQIFNLLRSISLRQYLLLPFLTLFFVSLSSLILFAYWSSQKSIDQFESQLSSQITTTVTTRLERFFAGATIIASMNAQAIQAGLLNATDFVTLQKQFVTEIKDMTYLSFISFGNMQGEYVGAVRTPDTDDVHIMTSLVAEGSTMNEFDITEQNTRGRLIKSGSHVDATTRPWFVNAQKNGYLSWYPVYKYIPYNSMGIGVSAPVYDQKTNALQGVVAADLALEQISDYMRSLELGQHGIAFIVDLDGKLIATSSKKPVFYPIEKTVERYSLADYPDQRLQQLVNHQQMEGIFPFMFKGERYLLNQKYFRDSKGLSFMIGVVLADQDFTKDFQDNVYLAGIAIVILSLMSIILGIRLTHRIVRPIEHLTQTTAQIAAGQLHATICEAGQVREFNQLGHSFNQMTLQLATAFDVLENRISERTAELEQANQKLTELSITDSLTTLANRRHFDAMFMQTQEDALRKNTPLSLLILDVDWFKNYNDHYGHIAGDDCLKQVAQTLKENTNSVKDLPARYGGEEFVVILSRTDSLAAEAIAQKIRQAVEKLALPHALSSIGYITVSIGVATWTQESEYQPDALLSLADAALYRAKNAGRNQVSE
jgi:diguanylate cyclase (GGDEF)-like protein